jgi:hypothetical protein
MIMSGTFLGRVLKLLKVKVVPKIANDRIKKRFKMLTTLSCALLPKLILKITCKGWNNRRINPKKKKKMGVNMYDASFLIVQRYRQSSSQQMS